jgi:hypothetical protein
MSNYDGEFPVWIVKRVACSVGYIVMVIVCEAVLLAPKLIYQVLKNYI